MKVRTKTAGAGRVHRIEDTSIVMPTQRYSKGIGEQAMEDIDIRLGIARGIRRKRDDQEGEECDEAKRPSQGDPFGKKTDNRRAD